MICRKCNTDSIDFRHNRRVCRECERASSRARSFEMIRGITHDERDQLLKEQGGICACCGSDNPGSIKGWHVDHSHATGKIRGILCATCNIALGQVNDSEERLQQLITYLRRCNDYLERE